MDKYRVGDNLLVGCSELVTAARSLVDNAMQLVDSNRCEVPADAVVRLRALVEKVERLWNVESSDAEGEAHRGLEDS